MKMKVHVRRFESYFRKVVQESMPPPGSKLPQPWAASHRHWHFRHAIGREAACFQNAALQDG